MIRPARPLAAWMTPAALTAALLLIGCDQPQGDTVEPTPGEVISPEIPEATEPAAADETYVEPPADEAASGIPLTPIEPAPAPEPEPTDSASTGDLELRPVTFDELKAHIAEGDAPVTLVDCWASWCDPCKENFPHVVEMAEKYGEQGLRVIALSFDAGTEVDDIDAAQITEAKRFLSGMDVSKIENLRHGQLLGESFEAFGVTTIPAVFLYDADGNEIARYTYDDPANQFTYEEVEEKVAELLGAQ